MDVDIEVLVVTLKVFETKHELQNKLFIEKIFKNNQ